MYSLLRKGRGNRPSETSLSKDFSSSSISDLTFNKTSGSRDCGVTSPEINKRKQEITIERGTDKPLDTVVVATCGGLGRRGHLRSGV